MISRGARLLESDLQVGRLRLHHVTGGRGTPPVLFIHGLGSSGAMEWRFNLPVISRRHHVFAPDLPGCGRSQKPRAPYGISYFASTVDRYMEACGLASAAVVGASMGGRVAMELALEYPARVQRLVLVNTLGLGRPALKLYYPLLMLPRVGESMLRGMRAALQRVPPATLRRFASRYAGSSADVERTFDDAYLAQMRDMHSEDDFHSAYLSTVRSLVRPSNFGAAADLTGRLRELGVPLQLIWGAEDALFPVEQARRAHRELTGSVLTVIEGAGHTPQADRPDEFNRALGRFLAA